MTAQGRYSGKPRMPKQAEHVTQVRIIGPAHVVDQVRQVLEMAADTMPGWRIAKTSRALDAHQTTHVRRYVDLEVLGAAPTPACRHRYPSREEEHDA